MMALIKAKVHDYSFYQGIISGTNFCYKFSTTCEMVEQQRGTFIKPELLIAKWVSLNITVVMNADNEAEARNVVSEEVKACLFINYLSREHHWKCKRLLANAMPVELTPTSLPLGMPCPKPPTSYE